jgi:hypothetical protein
MMDGFGDGKLRGKRRRFVRKVGRIDPAGLHGAGKRQWAGDSEFNNKLDQATPQRMGERIEAVLPVDAEEQPQRIFRLRKRAR